jgi:hypothetical protein
VSHENFINPVTNPQILRYLDPTPGVPTLLSDGTPAVRQYY